ncbi:hypothetical protein [Enterobacillus tribolii]|uniref:hypothetical protein n=1 Tax=Enterobacillus tribolii TaxID=1487935 RepID=UPI000E1CFF6E|nr:hypothetical protein [Enterobacillus tribolii]MBW7983970.1 hypothetical protein [Enterobacillus tribolii]
MTSAIDDVDRLFCEIAAIELGNGRFVITDDEGQQFYIKVQDRRLLRYHRFDEGDVILPQGELPQTQEEVRAFAERYLGKEFVRNDGCPMTDSDYEEVKKLIHITYEMSVQQDSTLH